MPLNTNSHSNTASNRHLRVLLLSPTSTSPENVPATLDRIHHFAGLTGGQDLIIVFLLSSATKATPSTSTSAGPIPSAPEDNTAYPTLAFAHLQASLLPRTDIPYIPILPVSSLSNLPDLLQRHASALSARYQQTPTTSNITRRPLELLQLATTEPPMDRETVYFATDCFANLREMAMACTEPGVDLSGLLGSPAGFEGLRPAAGQGRAATERLRELRDLVGEEKFWEIVDFWADEWTVD